MTPQEYERLQESLRRKLYEAKPPEMTGRRGEGYAAGIKAAMSIIHSFHKHNQTNIKKE